MKVGEKVKHKNTGDHIYEIKSINKYVAILKRPKQLYEKLNPKSKSSLIIKTTVSSINNLLKP